MPRFIRFILVFVVVVCSILSAHKLQAQRGELDYAVGMRFGTGTGLSVQKFLTNRKAVEGILYTRWRGFNLCGLMHFHERIVGSVKGLKWYYGGGAHVGYYTYYAGHPGWQNDRDKGGLTVAGFDGILGMEFYFPDLPVQISVDWKPEFNVIGWSGFGGDNGAISVRWRF
jgi:hypothetical protein